MELQSLLHQLQLAKQPLTLHHQSHMYPRLLLALKDTEVKADCLLQLVAHSKASSKQMVGHDVFETYRKSVEATLEAASKEMKRLEEVSTRTFFETHQAAGSFAVRSLLNSL